MDVNSLPASTTAVSSLDRMLEQTDHIAQLSKAASGISTFVDPSQSLYAKAFGISSAARTLESINTTQKIIERQEAVSKLVEQYAGPPAWLAQFDTMQKQVEQILRPWGRLRSQFEDVAQAARDVLQPTISEFYACHNAIQRYVQDASGLNGILGAVQQIAPYIADLGSTSSINLLNQKTLDILGSDTATLNQLSTSIAKNIQRRQEQIDEWLRSGGDPDEPLPDLADDQYFDDQTDDQLHGTEEKVDGEVHRIVKELTETLNVNDNLDNDAPQLNPTATDSSFIYMLLFLLPGGAQNVAYETGCYEKLNDLLEARKQQDLTGVGFRLSDARKILIILLILSQILSEVASEYSRKLRNG